MHNLHLFVTWATSHEHAAECAKNYFNDLAEGEGVDYFVPFKVRKQGSDKVVVLDDWAASRYTINLSDENLKKEYKDFFENTTLKKFLHLENDTRLNDYTRLIKSFAKMLCTGYSMKEFVEFVKENKLELNLFRIMISIKDLYNLHDTSLVEKNYDFWEGTCAHDKLATPFGLTNDTVWEEIADDSYEKYIVAIDVHS